MAIQDNPSQTGSLAMSLVVSPLVVVAIILRFIATRKAARKVGAEDWCAFLATVSCLGYNSLSIWCITVLNGREFFEVSLETLRSILKASYMTTQFFPLNQFFAKTSILLLYNRIFGVNRTYRIWIWALFIANLSWTIAAVLGLLFQCSPANYYWDRASFPPVITDGKCLDEASLLIGFEVPNSSIDFAMVGLALVMLRDLRMRRVTRWKVMGFFAAGGFAGMIGFVKIAAHFTAGQMSNTVLSLWGNAQMLLSILCCCVPIYNSLFTRRRKNFSGSQSSSPSYGRYYPKSPGTPGTSGTNTFGGSTLASFTTTTTTAGSGKGSIQVSREYGTKNHYRPDHVAYAPQGPQYGLGLGSLDEKIHHQRPSLTGQHEHGHSRTFSADSEVLAPITSNFSTGTGATLAPVDSQTPLFQQDMINSSPSRNDRDPKREQKGTYGTEWARLYDQCSSTLSPIPAPPAPPAPPSKMDLGLIPQTVTTVSAGPAYHNHDGHGPQFPPPSPQAYRPSQGQQQHGHIQHPSTVFLPRTTKPIQPEPRRSNSNSSSKSKPGWPFPKTSTPASDSTYTG